MTAPSVPPVVPPVAEVVARHRGRVVDVQHIRWSEPPAVAPAAWVGGGAFVLLVGLALALHAVAQVEALTCAAPPCSTTGGSAGLGVLLAALGLVPLVLGLVRWRDRARARYTIGEAPDVDLTVALAGADSLPLVIGLEQGLVLGLPPGARGSINGPRPVDVAEAVAQGRRSIALPADARARIELGELTFEIHHVPPAEAPHTALELDRPAWLAQLASAAILGTWFVLLGRAELQPPALDVPEQLERVAQYLTSPTTTPTPPAPALAPPRAASRPPRATPVEEEPVPEPPPAPAVVVVDADSGLVAPTSPTAFVRRHKHGTGRTDSEHDYDRVAGHLGDEGFTNAVDDFTVAMKRGQRAYAITPEVNAWWAEATGGPPRTSKHFGGLDLAETERGGGVHGDKPAPPKKPVSSVTLAAARPLPPPTAEEEARIRRLTTIEMDPPSFTGDAGIDRTRLYQYAREKMAAWRTCYESGLDKNPDLGGVTKLVIQFDAHGAVTSASIAYTTRNIGAIDRCLTDAVKRWKLTPAMPKPTTAVFHLQFSARTR